MTNNTIYLGNKNDLNKDFDIKVSGNENDFSNTPLVSDGISLVLLVLIY
jgi:hypothetical protein